MIQALGVIPARLGSTRLKEKVLKSIQGRPMIQHVWERASRARKLKKVVVACDDARIERCVKAFGGEAVLTSPDHPNGTSRVAEAAQKYSVDVVINIQGDEPLIHPQAIDELVSAFENDEKVDVATLAVKRTEEPEYLNPNVVKVICDQRGDALYFSRAPIPHFRTGTEQPFSFLKHLGIYGYRRSFLLEFVRWNPSRLEDTEKLEQLRILEKGFKIRVIETPYNSLSVDTQDDLELVENEISRQGA